MLTIGASDSSGLGGVQGDLRVCQALGVHGAVAVTAVEARGLGPARRRVELPARIIEAQIDAVARDLDASAVKIGGLASWQTIETVAARLRRRRLPNVVLHAGIFNLEGERVIGARGVVAMRTHLLPRARVVVMSAPEAGLLAETAVGSVEEAKTASARLRANGAEAVVVTGLPKTGLWLDWDGLARGFDWPAADGGSMAVGLLATAIAARLALGDGVEEAIAFALGLPNPAGATDILQEQ